MLNKPILTEQFMVFATRECKGSSRLYEQLSLAIADDDEMLQMASYCREGQPVPNLFLLWFSTCCAKRAATNCKSFTAA